MHFRIREELLLELAKAKHASNLETEATDAYNQVLEINQSNMGALQGLAAVRFNI